ncbi:chaperone DnaJ protein [Strigomonas culicis]|uniref:Chaperone DnaJ protein n=1 Tax=Strigomonas culicis TaxID=28005 RepID=S9UDU0_9TRYP|nr:chaperone DnaJ protein [Strigomonas culicis]EPY35832.1 chaperone DnaJ protein [Strigomonas culicis]|eukprot:EPY26914.1 chaperone DnaJ protein [Strigomonas culicis]
MFRRCPLFLCSVGKGPFDPYKILGITPAASKKEIKSAYHRLVLKYHPDTGPEGNAERFNAVHEAYEAVKDGKWKPTAEAQRSGADNGPYGWDPKMRMYVYEQPGSTKDGYVSGQTEVVLKIVMITCFLFVFIRFAMLWSSKRASNKVHALQHDESAPTDSVHADDGNEVQWTSFAHAENETTSSASSFDQTVDPFSRK